jgi:hypothetical protein
MRLWKVSHHISVILKQSWHLQIAVVHITKWLISKLKNPLSQQGILVISIKDRYAICFPVLCLLSWVHSRALDLYKFER